MTTTVNNTSSSPANVYAWIDFDRDGEFDEDERAASATVAANSSNAPVTLNWSNISGSGPDVTAGESYVRVRVTTEDLDSSTETTDRDDASVGVAINGEVEDYTVAIASPGFSGTVGTPAMCTETTVGSAELAAQTDGTSRTYTSAGGGNRDLTVAKTAGIDSAGGPSAPLNSITPGGVVSGIWLGSDDQYPAKSTGAISGLDEETYQVTFDDDVIQTQLTFAAINFNGDGDERIEIVRIEDGSGADVTASTIFAFTDGTPSGQGGLQFNATTGRVEGTVYDPGTLSNTSSGTYGNSNGRLTIDRAAGLRKIVFKRIEIDNSASAKAQPAENRSNGVTLGPISYCLGGASDPSVLLTKRITRINGSTTTLNGDDLAMYNPDAAYPYDDNLVEPTLAPNPPSFPTADTDKWPGTDAANSSTFLLGGRNGGETKPGDEIEYTIYFLSAGAQDAVDVQICDRIPNSQTFVPDVFNSQTPAPGGGAGANRGILVEYDGATLAYSNDADGDTARFYPPGASLPDACRSVPNQSEDNGAVVVDLGTLPNATSPGTPDTSYGLIRFRSIVK